MLGLRSLATDSGMRRRRVGAAPGRPLAKRTWNLGRLCWCSSTH